MNCSTSPADMCGNFTDSTSVFDETGFLLRVPRRQTLDRVSTFDALVITGSTRDCGSHASRSFRNESSPSLSTSERWIEPIERLDMLETFLETSVSVCIESSGLLNVFSTDWLGVTGLSSSSSSSSSASVSSLDSSAGSFGCTGLATLICLNDFSLTSSWLDQMARMSFLPADSADETRFFSVAVSLLELLTFLASGTSNDLYGSSSNDAETDCTVSLAVVSLAFSSISTVASLSTVSGSKSLELPSSAETKSDSLSEVAVLCSDTWRDLVSAVGSAPLVF
ncbi:hypothetical protein OGAPHI_005273 [Ogataea philodendri]|uniref:Uncharacterized protein n=1 Tax=Ogataea philodendri TaxID=1378263 RepID=A0A9P8P231_9ASCO|nr:uncharacterized protein OGAPHI_005273 [Ogataea philodendri]KAH3663870.1 hypothetical protein OGAPHI_005273 [Ogataea philodendri]